MSADGDRPRVLLQQMVCPQYRMPLFRRLAAAPDYAVRFAFGAPPASWAVTEGDTAGLPVEPLRNRCWFGRRFFAAWQDGLLPLLDPERIDIFIGEYNPRILSNCLALRRARGLGVPVAWWGHGFGAGASRLTRWLRLWFTRRSDAVILYGQAQADQLIAAGIPAGRVFVAPNSLDTEEIDPLARPWDEADPVRARPRILFIGRLYAQKRVFLLLRAFAAVRDRLPAECRLTVVGEGPELAGLKTLADDLGLADVVEFPGAIYAQAELAPYFNTACVSVCPGEIGLSAIHALAWGVPVLVADDAPHGPEVAALRNGINSSVFRCGDAESLGRALVAMLADPQHLRRLGTAGRSWAAEAGGIERMVEAFDRLVAYLRPQRRNA